MTTGPAPEEVSESAPPALFEHCRRTYEAMYREAKPVSAFTTSANDQVIHDDEVDSSAVMVYEGFFTQLVTSQLNLSVPYFTSIRKALNNMGCVRQLKRGGGTSPSQWELITEPTLELFMNQQTKREKKPTKDAVLQEQIDSLHVRVSDLEDKVEAVLEALADQFGTKPQEED